MSERRQTSLSTKNWQLLLIILLSVINYHQVIAAVSIKEKPTKNQTKLLFSAWNWVGRQWVAKGVGYLPTLFTIECVQTSHMKWHLWFQHNSWCRQSDKINSKTKIMNVQGSAGMVRKLQSISCVLMWFQDVVLSLTNWC